MKFWNYLRPLLPTRSDYSHVRGKWQNDILAGITVGIVALPLALAFGVSSGVGAEVGLVTAVVAGIIAAIFGGSHVQISGPTGAMVVVLAPIVVAHGVGAVALLSIIAGVMVLIAGFLKLGRFIGFVPWPVIEGFTFGIAVIIFMQQVPAALGQNPGPSTNALVAAFESIQDSNWAQIQEIVTPILIVLAVAAIMVYSPALLARVPVLNILPGSIIAIILVTLPVVFFNIPVQNIGELPSSLPAPAIPAIDMELVGVLLGPALAVAALAAIESLLSIRVAAGLGDTGPYDGDREMIGQGLASIAAGFFSGMPATGAIARTAVNIRAGGRSRIASISHSLILVLIIYLASTVVAVIPLAALSGVLMVTAVRMVSISALKSIVGSTKSDTFVYFLTALITVSFDLIIAVVIGITVASFLALKKLASSSGVIREAIPGESHPGDEQIALFRIQGSLFFGASENIMDEISKIKNIQVVILMFSEMKTIDATGAHAISELIYALRRRGMYVFLKGVPDHQRHILSHVGTFAALRDKNFHFENIDDALTRARSLVTPVSED